MIEKKTLLRQLFQLEFLSSQYLPSFELTENLQLYSNASCLQSAVTVGMLSIRCRIATSLWKWSKLRTKVFVSTWHLKLLLLTFSGVGSAPMLIRQEYLIMIAPLITILDRNACASPVSLTKACSLWILPMKLTQYQAFQSITIFIRKSSCHQRKFQRCTYSLA